MAEPGGGGGCAGEGSVPLPLESANGKLPLTTSNGDRGSGESNGGKCKIENTPSSGVSNGDCARTDGKDDSGSAQPESPGIDKVDKQGLPRRSSIIKEAKRKAFILAGLNT